MNAQHKINKLRNRMSRIARRLRELNNDKSSELMIAEKNQREPNLGGILSDIHRLENRQRQISEVLA